MSLPSRVITKFPLMPLPSRVMTEFSLMPNSFLSPYSVTVLGQCRDTENHVLDIKQSGWQSQASVITPGVRPSVLKVKGVLTKSEEVQSQTLIYLAFVF